MLEENSQRIGRELTKEICESKREQFIKSIVYLKHFFSYIFHTFISFYIFLFNYESLVI